MSRLESVCLADVYTAIVIRLDDNKIDQSSLPHHDYDYNNHSHAIAAYAITDGDAAVAIQ